MYHFDRMTMHDVAVTEDGRRMLCVGTLNASGDGLQPSKSRAEKQIISEDQSLRVRMIQTLMTIPEVYNLDKKEIER